MNGVKMMINVKKEDFENSFDGKMNVDVEKIFSRKSENRIGVGLESMRSICEKYGLETIDVALPGVCRKESYAMWEDASLRSVRRSRWLVRDGDGLRLRHHNSAG